MAAGDTNVGSRPNRRAGEAVGIGRVSTRNDTRSPIGFLDIIDLPISFQFGEHPIPTRFWMLSLSPLLPIHNTLIPSNKRPTTCCVLPSKTGKPDFPEGVEAAIEVHRSSCSMTALSQPFPVYFNGSPIGCPGRVGLNFQLKFWLRKYDFQWNHANNVCLYF